MTVWICENDDHLPHIGKSSECHVTIPNKAHGLLSLRAITKGILSSNGKLYNSEYLLAGVCSQYSLYSGGEI